MLKKAESKWWDRLLAEAGKSKFITTDWDRWQDEDDDGYKAALDDDQMDFSSMMGGGMGGMGGMGGIGGMDLAAMMKNMGGAGAGAGAGGLGDDDDDDDDDADDKVSGKAKAGADDDDLPPLEEIKK